MRVRRYGWSDRWLVRRAGNVWQIVPHVTAEGVSLLPTMRVVQSGDFGIEEYHAEDWTEAPPEENNVCVRPGRTTFVPPGIDFSAMEHEGGLRLIATLGSGSVAGAYWLRFRVNGVEVAVREAAASGSFIVDTSRGEAVKYECLLEVTSSLPLPAWTAQRRAEAVLPALPPLPDTLAVNFTVLGLGPYTRILTRVTETGWEWNVGDGTEQGFFGDGYGVSSMAGYRVTVGDESGTDASGIRFEWEDGITTTQAFAGSQKTAGPLGLYPECSGQAFFDPDGIEENIVWGTLFTFTAISIEAA